MSTITISRFEWIRLFGSLRGWVSVTGFVLVWLLVLNFIIRPAARFLSSSDSGGIAGLLLQQMGWESVASWPAPELALYWVVALYLLPFFTVVVAADQIASDKSRGTLRYLALRASRNQLFFGRFVGQCVIQLMLIVGTLASVVGIVAMQSPDLLPAVLASAPIVVVNLVLVLLPYVALMALVSVLARSARQATLFAVIAWILVSFIVGYIQRQYGPLPVLDWVLPGSQVPALLKLQGWQTLDLALVPVIHTVVLLLGGWWAMQRSDL